LFPSQGLFPPDLDSLIPKCTLIALIHEKGIVGHYEQLLAAICIHPQHHNFCRNVKDPSDKKCWMMCESIMSRRCCQNVYEAKVTLKTWIESSFTSQNRVNPK